MPGSIVEFNVLNADQLVDVGFDAVQISPERSYILEGSLSCLDTTGDVTTFVELSRFNMDRFVDQFEWGENHLASLTSLSRTLRSHYLKWRETTATPEEKTLCGIGLLFGIGTQFGDYAWEVSDHAVAPLIGSEITVSDDLVANTIRRKDRLSRWNADVAQGIGWLKTDYESCVSSNLKRTLDKYVNRNVFRGSPPPPKATRKEKRRVRQTLKKSSNVFASVLGEGSLRRFVSGEEIIVPGNVFDFSFRKTVEIIRHTGHPSVSHVPFDMSVYDKSGGERLCSICIYVPKTPVLDQVAAMALYVKSGDEEELIRKGNLFNRCKDFDNHPEMKRLGKTRKTNPKNTVNAVIGELNVNAMNGIILGDFEQMISSEVMPRLGVTGQVFREEIVPWRARFRQTILQNLANQNGLSEPVMTRIAERDGYLDELVYNRQLPEKLDDFINAYF